MAYKCEICPARFICKSNLIDHNRIHTLERPFKCKVCEKRFTQNSNLTKHFQAVHEKKKIFNCTFCKKDFSQKVSLYEHILRHVDEKPYSCQICIKCFCQKCHLDLHLRTHTGEKQYQCEICPKSFFTKSSLTLHKKVHAAKTHKCSTCGVNFENKYLMRIHLSTVHNAMNVFQCQRCPKNYTQAENLKRHEENIHQNVSSDHWCIFCPRDCHSKTQLFFHLRVHVNEKPVFCRLCDASFPTLDNRRMHVQKYHNHKDQGKIECKGTMKN